MDERHTFGVINLYVTFNAKLSGVIMEGTGDCIKDRILGLVNSKKLGR